MSKPGLRGFLQQPVFPSKELAEHRQVSRVPKTAALVALGLTGVIGGLGYYVEHRAEHPATGDAPATTALYRTIAENAFVVGKQTAIPAILISGLVAKLRWDEGILEAAALPAATATGEPPHLPEIDQYNQASKTDQPN